MKSLLVAGLFSALTINQANAQVYYNYADWDRLNESDRAAYIAGAYDSLVSIATAFVRAALNGPPPAPYPVQRGLASGMREAAKKAGDAERMQMWAGQSAKLARAEPAGEIVRQLWDHTLGLLKQAATT